jgi:HTH-type transcriptional regulator, sugar sensing transcriptional regulator
MIVKQELVKQIKEYFNLNIYETKVWLALLSKGIASAGEIAELSGVPRSRTYDVLESLEKEGFAIAKLGKPVKYIAVSPTTVVEKLKSNTLRRANESVSMLSNLKETKEYVELEQLYKGGIEPVRHQNVSGAIKGKSNIFNHLKELLEGAKKEVLICTSATEINDRSRIFSSLFNNIKKRKIILKVALSGDENEIKKVNAKFKINAQKLDVHSRFFMTDREQLLFMLSQSQKDDEEVGVWINSGFFVNSLSYLFEKAWGN